MNEHLIYCLMGDGELEEGQNREALMFAAGHKVDNIIAVIDYNGVQIDGPNKKVMPMGDLEAKFDTFGWKALTMSGNDMNDVVNRRKKRWSR